MPKQPVRDFVRNLSFRRSKDKKKKKDKKAAESSQPTAAEAAQAGFIAAGSAGPSHEPIPVAAPRVPVTVGTIQREDRPLVLGTQPSRSEASVRRKEWEYENIILQKVGRGLGFNIQGGTDEAERDVVVTKISEGGTAALDGRLRVGDVIVSVNGTSYNGLTHGEAVDVLRNAGNTVHLAVKRIKREADKPKTIEIMLNKNGSGLGFSIAGGSDDQHRVGDDGIYVTKITEGGVAQADGRIRLGDKLIFVNDINIEHVTHAKAIHVLKSTLQQVTLVVMRDNNNNNNNNSRSMSNLNKSRDSARPGSARPGSSRSKSVERFFNTDTRNGPEGTNGPANYPANGPVRIPVNGPVRNPANGPDYPANGPDGYKASGLVNLQSTGPFVPSGEPGRYPGNGPAREPWARAGVGAGVGAARGGAVRDDRGRQESSSSGSGESESEETESESKSDVPIYSTIQSRAAAAPVSVMSPAVDVKPPAAPAASTRITAAQAVNGGRDWPELVPQIMTNEDMPQFIQEPRQVILKKRVTESLGFNIVGGRDGTGQGGVFISSLLPGSVAEKSEKLKRGDQLLSVNGVDLRNSTHEAATDALKAVGETAVIIVQYRIEEFNHLEQQVRAVHAKMAVERGTDIKLPVLQRVIYFKTLSDYDSRRDNSVQYGKGLSYEFGDILHVIVPQDGSDWWQARRIQPIRELGQQSGIIPSRRKMEERLGVSLRPKNQDSTTEGRDDFSKTKRRRSFLLSKRISLDSISSRFRKSSSHDVPETPASPPQSVMYYQPVVQMQSQYTRPVIILGVMKDQLNNDLIAEFPNRFSGCVPHTTRPIRAGERDGVDYHFVPDRSVIDRGVVENKFIEAGLYLDHTYAVSNEAVLGVAKQNKHCILEVSLKAVPRLEALGLHPIVILIKPVAPASVSLIHRPISEDAAKRLYQTAVDIYEESKHLLNAVVVGDTPDEIFRKVKDVIWRNSSQQIWVNSYDPAYFI